MPRLCEPFAGLGSFSLRCLWEAAGSDPRMRWEPPVSRQGSKSGFVINEFRAFGLVRQKWEAVLLNDLDPVCHLFHMLYASAELRDLVARRLWAMVPCLECLHEMREAAMDGTVKPTPAMCLEWLKSGMGKVQDPDCTLCSGTGVMDARQLWEKIRKEPVPGDLVEACAAGLWLQSGSFGGSPIHNVNGVWRMGKGKHLGCATTDGDSPPTAVIASRVSSLPSGMASLADLTARALFMQSRSFQLLPVSIAGGAWDGHGWKPEVDRYFRQGKGDTPTEDSPRWTVAERVAALPGKWVESGYKPEVEANCWSDKIPRWTVADRVSLLPGPGGCHIGISRMDALEFVRGLELGKDDVLVLDPPYEGTSGYQAQSCRADVLEIAHMAHEAGALVLLHESVGLAAELGKGWNQRSASPLRGRASTFHKDGIEKEMLTTNRVPCWWPAHQSSMF